MTEESPSLSQALWQKTLDRVINRLGLEEQLDEQGGPHLPLLCQAPMYDGPVGQVRVFTGGPLFQLVTSTIVVPPIQLDSHMMFAFMPSDSPVPHFTLDSVRAGEHHAFHLDLIPRVDLGSRLAYMDECFTPLNEAHEKGEAIEGLSRAQLSPRQYAIMSPWMLAHRATPEAFTAIEGSVDEYLDHWFGLVENGVSAESIEGISRQEMVERDRRNKAIIFNEDVDKVWDQILPLVGREAVDTQIELLRQTSE
jgi:hypothetical protein